VRIDAVFEAVLGVTLVVGGATGWLNAEDLAGVGQVAVVVFGIVLLGAATFLWRGRVRLATLALANLVTAVAAFVWLALDSGFSSAGAAIVAMTAIALLCLAAMQAATLRRWAPART
jgi:thiol:disulfide interchange protein